MHRRVVELKIIRTIVVTALLVFFLFIGLSCRSGRVAPDDPVAQELWNPAGYPIRLFPRNKTYEMFTRNKELGPYKASFNDEGVRDKKYSLQKPYGTIRIVVLGDSYLFGWGVEQDQTFDNQLEEIYAGQKKKVEALNLAIPGVNHISELNILKAVGLKYHPDIVLLGINGDDIFPDNNNYLFKTTPPLPPKFDEFKQGEPNKVKIKYMSELTKIKSKNALIKQGYSQMWDIFAKTPITEIVGLSKKSGFKLVLLYEIKPPMRLLYNALEKENRIESVDITNINLMLYLDGQNAKLPVLSIPGDGHPTAAALNIFARHVAANLRLPPPTPGGNPEIK